MAGQTLTISVPLALNRLAALFKLKLIQQSKPTKNANPWFWKATFVPT
jgi:hypothetical protein